MPEVFQKTAIVVGGGVAGLVTARQLARGDVDVRVFEASDRLGGTVAKHTVAGIDLDAGAESFATRNDSVARLAHSLGLTTVLPAELGSWLHDADGRPVKLPATSVYGIPADPLAPDVVAVIGQDAANRAAEDATLDRRIGADVETLGDLVRVRMGAELLERLVTPIVFGVHSQHPNDLPLDRVAPGLREGLVQNGSLAAAVAKQRENSPAGTAVAGIDGGMFRLVEELATDLERRGVEVRTGSRAWAIKPQSVLVGGVAQHADLVVAAGPAMGVMGTRIALVTLVVDAPELDAAPRGTGVLVHPDAPGVRAKALTHSTAKWPWLASRAGGRHVLRLSFDPDRFEKNEDLFELARTDASTLLGVELPASAVLGADAVEWTRPPAGTDRGYPVVGETVAGTGLANVVSHALRESERWLEELSK
ncbi:protoporphyrinogen/coproporphyrinogen oxidase [Herbiconiux sp. SYSU D00978]|uniref:protoporphyrinogen/coproporphyrinogen oxidase n=1 Tax=Herbiconiux sp. SYSU D00978 TaxID=2812562 RepID=UPI001A974D8C|nr:FAD-dependent oxidoreductase [Herbiconiux sp. SYSU D00978]